MIIQCDYVIRLSFPNLASHLHFILIFVFLLASHCRIKISFKLYERETDVLILKSALLKFMCTIFSRSILLNDALWLSSFRAAVSSLFDLFLKLDCHFVRSFFSLSPERCVYLCAACGQELHITFIWIDETFSRPWPWASYILFSASINEINCAFVWSILGKLCNNFLSQNKETPRPSFIFLNVNIFSCCSCACLLRDRLTQTVLLFTGT